ncbi:neuropeptides capa receptor [Biomphalaria glabrata]|nr:neuropeptides capa receptor [Biomphalaria glabrata]
MSSNGSEPVVNSPLELSVLHALSAINIMVCSELIGLFGIAANIVNMINFRRQGFKDGVNVTLFTLSFCDLGALVAHQFSNMCMCPWIRETQLFMLKSHLFTIGFYLNGYFVRVSGWLTSFITFERCLCVVWPLKVKRVITPRTATLVNLAIVLLLSLYLFPPYFIMNLNWVVLPGGNQTILAIVFKSNRETIMAVYYFIADQFIPYSTILVLLLCTTITVSKLKSKLVWRQSTTLVAANKTSTATLKERKVVAMLINISIIFIVCLLPQSTLGAAVGLERELKLNGKYFNVLLMCYSFTSLLETINCSVSIFVYYTMSTKYRQEFWEIIRPVILWKNSVFRLLRSETLMTLRSMRFIRQCIQWYVC